MTNNTDLRTQNNATNSQRRTALKLAASSGLLSGAALTSGSWTKPAINAVLLPAHAQTSMMTVFSGSSSMVAKAPVLNRESILDLFVTPVHAGDSIGLQDRLVSVETYAEQTGEDAFDFQFLITASSRSCESISKGKIVADDNESGPIEDAIFTFIEISATGGSATIPQQAVCDGPATIDGDFEYDATDGNLTITANFNSVDFDVAGLEITMGPGGMPLTEPECVLCEEDVFTTQVPVVPAAT